MGTEVIHCWTGEWEVPSSALILRENPKAAPQVLGCFGIADPARPKATNLPKAAHLWSFRPRLRPGLRLSGPSSPQER